MTPKQLGTALAKLETQQNMLLDVFIAHGRGHETALETRALAKTGDPLAVKIVAVWDQATALRDEKKRRMTYHGSLKRIVQK